MSDHHADSLGDDGLPNDVLEPEEINDLSKRYEAKQYIEEVAKREYWKQVDKDYLPEDSGMHVGDLIKGEE